MVANARGPTAMCMRSEFQGRMPLIREPKFEILTSKLLNLRRHVLKAIPKPTAGFRFHQEAAKVPLQDVRVRPPGRSDLICRLRNRM